MNKITVIFTMDDVALTDAQREGLAELFAEWQILHKHNSRLLIDAVINENTLAAAQTALAAYNPNIIGTWSESGALTSANFDSVDYIAMLPPIISIDENDTITETPRTIADELHKFGGWPDRSMT